MCVVVDGGSTGRDKGAGPRPLSPSAGPVRTLRASRALPPLAALTPGTIHSPGRRSPAGYSQRPAPVGGLERVKMTPDSLGRYGAKLYI